VDAGSPPAPARRGGQGIGVIVGIATLVATIMTVIVAITLG